MLLKVKYWNCVRILLPYSVFFLNFYSLVGFTFFSPPPPPKKKKKKKTRGGHWEGRITGDNKL